MPAKLSSAIFKSHLVPTKPQICSRCLFRIRIHSRTLSRTAAVNDSDTPGRWSYTPERLRAPVPMTFHNKDKQWSVNESSKVLDDFYTKLLGEGGDTVLTDEVKWLAVTHKTFEQGKRGYNDRLGFLGKRIFNLQASLALLNRTDGTFTYPPDEHERTPFQHPGIDLLPRLTIASRNFVVNQNRVADFAFRQGMLKVMRWKPRFIRDLRESGVDAVLAGGVYAIIGAIALQRGGELANRFVRERILPDIGLPQQGSDAA
ncbi:MAG: hypothetical protein GOMPHAMPRED_000159 [Gomphillus americanus]|uniref:RNase III domain-containing protein n=1 Tax=Gomphillus americanus TaxID=1940652 RepID=A0A8H3EHT9_9LECA|nr:MAG: hypothetical protein GOMPHAMPRED_000159 [Gomphillus americanus]